MYGKKILVLTFAIAVSVFFILGKTAEARRTYLDGVNSTCGTNYSCGLCHIDPSGGGPLNSDGQAFRDSGYDSCYFCPDATACGGSACTDGDGDGFNIDGGSTCGAIDCNDQDPSINPGAVEVCNDGIDNDCDGAVDCDDPNCGNDPACPTCSREGKGKTCSDNFDNDCDNLIDCADPDCAGNRACAAGRSVGREGKGKTCSDGIDNDVDGLIDCADPDCARNHSCK